ncbi:Fc receptor-like protein 2 [Pseudophryne corroboree]|uniref:Fc receptor-like protein 2 n=1 Tax=Pseudophryne corroboree TaxID=495146 RepID=UPI003081F032
MTLTCDTARHPARASTELQFAFYRDGRNVQKFRASPTYSVVSAQLEHSGSYSCDVRTGSGSVWKRSDVLPIQIQALFETPQIKSNPSPVTEGDEMTLTCDTTRHPLTDTMELEFTFNNHNRATQVFSTSPTYSVPSAQVKHSGVYNCEVRVPSSGYWKSSDEVYIPIAALFDTPKIRNSWIPRVEGDKMVLVCSTTRNHAISTTELQFAFYRDRQVVQDFSASATYSIPAALLVHSGYYTCDVRTTSGSVRKKSNKLYIQIHVLFTTPVIRNNRSPVIEGDEMTLTCDTTCYPAVSTTTPEFIWVSAEQSDSQNYYEDDTYSTLSVQPVRSGDDVSDVVTPSGSVGVIMDTTDLEFAFYRDGQVLQDFSASATYSVPAAQPVHSGNYTCEGRTPSGSVRKESNELSIQVEALHVSLQRRNSLYYDVTESDEMTLTCHTNLSASATIYLEFAFHRDWNCEQNFSASATYRVAAAQLWHSGNYTCDVRMSGGSVWRSDVLSIQVEGIFSTPQIRNSRSSVTEGDNMTLTCDTRRYCVMVAAGPEFAFYRDGQIVQDFSASDTYSVPPAQLEDSGYYSCDVRMPRDSVRKKSDNVYIQIEGSTSENGSSPATHEVVAPPES